MRQDATRLAIFNTRKRGIEHEIINEACHHRTNGNQSDGVCCTAAEDEDDYRHSSQCYYTGQDGDKHWYAGI